MLVQILNGFKDADGNLFLFEMGGFGSYNYKLTINGEFKFIENIDAGDVLNALYKYKFEFIDLNELKEVISKCWGSKQILNALI